MHVIFVEPSFPKNQREFLRALSSVGARVTGIGEAPVEALVIWAPGGEVERIAPGFNVRPIR